MKDNQLAKLIKKNVAKVEKAQTKKAGVASITKLRKQRQRDGFAGELDMDAELARPGTGRKPAMVPHKRMLCHLVANCQPDQLQCRDFYGQCSGKYMVGS